MVGQLSVSSPAAVMRFDGLILRLSVACFHRLWGMDGSPGWVVACCVFGAWLWVWVSGLVVVGSMAVVFAMSVDRPWC
jgi:hypothetical protein